MTTLPPAPRHETPDDVDRLFARMDRAPVPVDLTSRVLASTVVRDQARQRALDWPWLVAAFCAMGALALAGYLLGAQLAASDGLDLLEGVAGDLSLLASAPGDILLALAEVVPLGLVGLAAASLALLVWAAGHIVSQSAALGAPTNG